MTEGYAAKIGRLTNVNAVGSINEDTGRVNIRVTGDVVLPLGGTVQVRAECARDPRAVPAAISGEAMSCSREHGTASLELVIVAPFLVALLMMIIAFGRFAQTENLIDQASRDAARAATAQNAKGEVSTVVGAGDRGDDGERARRRAATR